jgi:hypothetical protein
MLDIERLRTIPLSGVTDRSIAGHEHGPDGFFSKIKRLFRSASV